MPKMNNDGDEEFVADGVAKNPKYTEPQGSDAKKIYARQIVKKFSKLKNDQSNRPPGVNGGEESFEVRTNKDHTINPNLDADASAFVYEAITKKTDVNKVIDDFVHSDNPKFKGKSKKERIRMALGAYYSMHEDVTSGPMGGYAPAASDSPGTNPSQNPTPNSPAKTDNYQDDDDNDDSANEPTFKQQLEQIALASAHLYEMTGQDTNLDDSSQKDIDAVYNVMSQLYKKITNESSGDNGDIAQTDNKNNDDTDGKPNTTATNDTNESVDLSEMRLLDVYKSPCGKKVAKIYRDNQRDVHIVQYYKNGKHLKNDDTNHYEDNNDAHETAHHWVNEELKLLSEIRLLKTYSSPDGKKLAKVYKDPDWQEHIVKFYKNGKYLSKGDSFHGNDKEDAHNTAQHWINEESDNDPCWKGYKQLGMKMKNKKPVPNCVKEEKFSAKAGRAGKDLGKPGKNFKKIADKAAKEYGSKEAGKKVAGAILAKIRANHGVK